MNAYILRINQEANVLEQWDFGLVKDLLTEIGCEFVEVKELPKCETAAVIIAARHHKGLENKVNKQLKSIENPVLFCLGDEEADFDIEQIDLPADKIYIQNPHMGKHDKYNKIGTGYPQHFRKLLAKNALEKSTNVFFAGQITHKRRRELDEAMLNYSMIDTATKYVATRGFTQGESKEQYAQDMSMAKIAPCPSGAVIPDSFRLFEALECMAVPIADQKTARGQIMQYWDWLFSQDTPFYKTVDWNCLNGLVPEILKNYPQNMHKITAWYILWKRDLKFKLKEQLDV